MARTPYLDSEHAAKVAAYAATVQLIHTQKASFLSRNQAKNQIIMRHIYERLTEIAGPYDGIAGAKNYNKSGRPLKLKWGGPETMFDVHVVAWQQELIDAGIIRREEVLSPASVCMIMKWTITRQVADGLWKARNIACWRRPAIQAGWLLFKDIVELEKLNYPVGYTFTADTTEGEDDVEASTD